MENIGFGLQLTVLGMGLVFSLLAVLWGVLALLLRLDRSPAQAPAEPEARPAVIAPAQPAELERDTLAAITIAVLAHSAVLRQQAAPLMRSSAPGSLIHASRWVAGGRTRQNRSWQR
jgi:glutaconyl-CoA/methylmalonyl-CoA decarboxylase subunit delta